MIRFTYVAEAEDGTRLELQIDERDESTANVQAKIEVEKWAIEEGQPLERISRFDLVSQRAV